MKKYLLIAGWLVAGSIVACGAEREDDEEEEIEVQELREQLTEREDENRVEKPLVIQIHGRPLSLLGEYEISVEYVDQLAMGDTTNHNGQSKLDQEIEVEAFYPFNSWLSVFGQGRLVQEEDLDSKTPDGVSDFFAERGEMWFFAEEIADSPFSVEIGRLDFEDDRLWWWDEDLDAVRVTYERETYDIAFAAAREMLPTRSDRNYIEPEEDDVIRLITEASWDWSENHAVQFFMLSHQDRSRRHHTGELLRQKYEDESDAELLWTGLRASGAVAMERHGLIGYWADIGQVHGDEILFGSTDGLEEASAADEPAEVTEDEDAESEEPEPEPVPRNFVRVEERTRQDIRGWAFDVGATWMLPYEVEPRVTVGYAKGSGDDKPDDGNDHSFRQTGLQGNEPGFGGMQRFQGYGELLDPELSNIAVLTVGLGCSLLDSSSLDLVYHHYHLVERAGSLRDSQFDAELSGTSRDVGQGLDLVLALEEWERIEFELTASAFRAGKAFGRDRDEWNYGGFFATKLAF